MADAALGRLSGLVLAAALAAAGCPAPQSTPAPAPAPPPLASEPAPYQAEVAEREGAALVVLVDTSHSMGGTAPGERRRKSEVALEALESMFAATDAFLERLPGFPIRVALISFSSAPRLVLPIQDYDPDALRKALRRIPRPGGGTAIGEAMLAARPELYRSGVDRKYLLVVTDGYNTAGRGPEGVAREIHEKSDGGVVPFFVAFDTDPERFGFLHDVGGAVFRADDATQLETALDEIYRGRILAEAEDPAAPPIEPLEPDARP